MKRFVEKIALILAGLFLALLILEMGLQFAGLFVNFFRERHRNSFNMKNQDSISVMCIGESTTDMQYPKYLEEYLKEFVPDKNFTVIDSGYIGINMRQLRDKVRENIETYRPDIIVGMIGINDMIDYTFKSYSKIKIIYLLQLIFEHWNNNLKISDEYEEYKINKHDGSHTDVNEARIALNVISRQIFLGNNDYKLKDVLLPDKRSVLMSIYGMNDEFLAQFISLYYSQSKRNATIGDLLNDIYTDKNIKEEFRYAIKGIYNMFEGNYELGEQFLDKADVVRMTYDYTELSDKYEKILDLIIPQNIIYVAMQYPVRDIDNLKKIISNTKYSEKIFYVDNKQNFRNALKDDNKSAIFKDLFAWDFGHSEERGNRLIAQNLAENISVLLSQTNNN